MAAEDDFNFAAKIAKVHYDKYMEGVQDLEPSWEKLEESHRARMIAAMEAALDATMGYGEKT